MKPIFPFLFFLAFAAAASDAPQPIELRIKVIRSQAWYHEQALAWRDRAAVDKSSSTWLNYYTAAKYAQWSTDELQRIQSEVKQSGEQFASLLIEGWHAGYEGGYAFLQQASVIDRDNALLNSLLLMHYENRFDADKRAAASNRIFRSGVVSPSLLNYSYNLLMSLEENGILITDGDNTTIPVFILQDVFAVRKDVQILNLDLLSNDAYRNLKLHAAGLSIDNESGDKDMLCISLATSNPEKKIYYALTLPQQHIASIKDQLFVVGLASQASKNRIDNISFIRENLENRFLLDQLTVDFSGENQFSAGKVLSANYLVPMLLLFDHYKSTGNTEKVAKWQAVIEKLAKENNKELLVQNFIRKESTGDPFVSAHLDIEGLENMFKLVKGNIYANETEVTNFDYNRFLRFLQENKMNDLYEACKFDLTQYEEPSLSVMKNYHLDKQPNKKQKFFTNFPVVNIQQKGAVAYCQWLTEQYNHTPGRKFKKVKFRLPTLNEWRMAALGYKRFTSWDINENQVELSVPDDPNAELCKSCPKKLFGFKESGILYPWFQAYNFRDKPLNNRGCSLGNFKWPDNQKLCNPKLTSADGWVLMSPVQAYFPNDMGLYDVVGNVAEMIDEPGKACGGSWNHPPQESTILSVNEYTGPDAAIGFRVFMEVIEP